MKTTYFQELTASSPPVSKALTGSDVLPHSGSMTSAATLMKGFIGSASSLAVFGWVEWFARVESWLKVAALIVGGLVVPAFTACSLWRQIKIHRLEEKILEKKLKDDV